MPAEAKRDLPPPIKWNDMDAAPHDGSWLLLDVEDGSTDCVDVPASSVYVGRWNPQNYPELGEHLYEWEVIERYPDSRFSDGEILTHWAAGRIGGWLPIPANLNT